MAGKAMEKAYKIEVRHGNSSLSTGVALSVPVKVYFDITEYWAYALYL